jgi:transcriptional regulator with XRE-family HTH domain
MGTVKDEWRTALRAARRSAGISMETLAERSGISYETVRAYEYGRRSPRRATLLKVLAALPMTAADANALLDLIGFATESTLYPPHEFPEHLYRVDELQRVVDTRPWPAFVTNESISVVAANRAIQAVWSMSYAKEKRRRPGGELNLFAIAADAGFTERMTNWQDVLRSIASEMKGRPQRTTAASAEPRALAAMQAAAGGDPALLKRLLMIWAKAKPAATRVQWDLPLRWLDSQYGEMHFILVISVASERDALNFHDWHPIDASTWRVLEKVKARSARQRAKGSHKK